MPTSTLTFEQGEAIDVGAHGEHDFVFESGTPVPDTGESQLVFETGVGWGQARTVYASEKENTGGNVYELDPGDLSKIQSADAGDPDGCGGGPNTVWNIQGELRVGFPQQIQERNPSDLSVIKSGDEGVSDTTELGGKEAVLYSCGWSTDAGVFAELSTSDFSVIKSSTADKPNGIGGDEETVWGYNRGGSSDSKDQSLLELDPGDLSVVRSIDVGQGSDSAGGGTNSLYSGQVSKLDGSGGNTQIDEVYHRDPSDGSVITVASFDGPIGIGGS